MLKSLMHKFILQILFITYLNASEPVLAILDNINSNALQEFNIGKYSFYCSAYGIISLENLLQRTKVDSACKKSIDIFYKKNPDLRYFSNEVLHLRQRYHVSLKQNECLVYAKGELSLSELLLKNGLAVLKPQFKEEEFIYRFEKSELEAKLKRIGLWSSGIYKSCISELMLR